MTPAGPFLPAAVCLLQQPCPASRHSCSVSSSTAQRLCACPPPSQHHLRSPHHGTRRRCSPVEPSSPPSHQASSPKVFCASRQHSSRRRCCSKYGLGPEVPSTSRPSASASANTASSRGNGASRAGKCWRGVWYDNGSTYPTEWSISEVRCLEITSCMPLIQRKASRKDVSHDRIRRQQSRR